MTANPFKTIFSRLFGAGQGERVALDERQRAIVGRVIEFVVDNTDPRIRVVPHYKKKLTPAVVRTAQYLGGLIRSLPEPLELSRDAWSGDPRLNAFFAAAADVPQAMARSADLRAFFDAKGAPPEAFALMVMDKVERKVFGAALEGGVLRHDVAQINVSFSAHRIVAPAATRPDALVEIGLRGVRRMLDVVLARIAAIQQQATELSEHKAFLATKLRMLKSEGFGIEAHVDHAQEIARIEAELARAAKEVLEKKGNARSIEHYLEQINDVLLAPEQHLTASEVKLRVTRLGVKVEAGSPEPAHELVLTELRLGELSAIVVPVKCRGSDMPPKGTLLAEGAKYL